MRLHPVVTPLTTGGLIAVMATLYRVDSFSFTCKFRLAGKNMPDQNKLLITLQQEFLQGLWSHSQGKFRLNKKYDFAYIRFLKALFVVYSQLFGYAPDL